MIPCINVLNYYLTYTNISFGSHTLLTFFLDTMEGYAAWLGLRQIILYLDRKMPYAQGPGKRIVVQLLTTTSAGLFIIVVLTEAINRLFGSTPVPLSFYTFDIFIFLIWFLVINGIYTGLFYYESLRYTEHLRKQEDDSRNGGYLVKQGRQNLVIPFADIFVFYVEGDYSILLTRQLKKYFLDRSLDKIEKTVPANSFFRVNRQYIFGRSGLKGFSRAENGKLTLIYNIPDFSSDPIQVSRSKAPAFKLWWIPSSD